MQKIRFILSPLAAVAGAAFFWVALVKSIPGAGSMSFVGLVPTLGAGLVGGVLAAVIAPQHKLPIAICLGFIVGGGLVGIIFLSGRFPLLGRNPLFWYWPAWLIPSFSIGGLIGSLLTSDV
mgnify:CR=1 FL=1